MKFIISPYHLYGYTLLFMQVRAINSAGEGVDSNPQYVGP